MRKVYHASQHVTQLLLFPTRVCNECHIEKILEIDFYERSGAKRQGQYEAKCKLCRYAQRCAREGKKLPTSRRKPKKTFCTIRDEEKHQRHIAYCRQYRIDNIEQELARHRTYDVVYRKRIKTQFGMSSISIYYATHPDKLPAKRARGQVWKQANPLKGAESRKRREARKKELFGDPVDYAAILERDGCVCHICSRDIDLTLKKGPGRLHFDHVIPLARQGIHTEENIRPSHAICNARKGTHLLNEMIPWQRRGPDV